MTAAEKRAKVIAQAKPCIGRNLYSQDAARRECVFTKYKDGKYYSDCSSFVRWLYRKAGLYSNIGGNTVGIMGSKLGVEIDCKIKEWRTRRISALRVGDLLLFRGNNASRAGARYVGHVEMVYAIKGNTVTLIGHGSGNPKTRNMKTYCRTRWLTLVANTKIKNRGLICVKRFIADDTSFLSPGDRNEHVRTMQKGAACEGVTSCPSTARTATMATKPRRRWWRSKGERAPSTGYANEVTLMLILGVDAPVTPIAPADPTKPVSPLPGASA